MEEKDINHLDTIKVYREIREMQSKGEPTFADLEINRGVACNVNECYFQVAGGCIAVKAIITNEGCMTDRNLVED